MKKLLFLIIFLALVVPVNGENFVPALVNYQGMLTDSNGEPLRGTKELKFNIYDSASGGNLVWGPQVFGSVPLLDGKFNVILGSTDNAGRSIVEAFSENKRYLSISIDGDAELAPRQQILSAPFAIQADHSFSAKVSETVRGPDLFVDPATGNVGVGTTEPRGRLDMGEGNLVSVNWEDSDMGEGSGLAPDTILCTQSRENYRTSRGLKTINFSAADCGGTLPSESYIGVIKSIDIACGNSNYKVNDFPEPGISFWTGDGVCGRYDIKALYIKTK